MEPTNQEEAREGDKLSQVIQLDKGRIPAHLGEHATIRQNVILGGRNV